MTNNKNMEKQEKNKDTENLLPEFNELLDKLDMHKTEIDERL